jgi:hypothetical protein
MAATDGSFEVTVEQQPETGDAVVTVTDGDAAVENATVVVESDDGYDGTGSYETDANGTATLQNPNETVNVTLTVSVNDSVQTAETQLVPRADSLEVGVEDDDGNATVTVSQYGEPVENATLDVSGENYTDNGTYTTDENGTVELSVPDEPTEVTLNASVDDLSTERTVTLGEYELELDVEEDDNVTVEVTRNDTGVKGANVSVEAAEGESYDGEGDYVTGENGTVELPGVPVNETVNVTVTATDDDDTVSKNVTLGEMDETEYRTFGGILSAYVHQLLSGAAGGIGDDVSEFARENNPGNADHENRGNGNGNGNAAESNGDNPGKGDEMRDKKDRDETEDDEGTETPTSDDDDDESEDSDDGDDDDDDDDRRGPPSHANN